MRSAYRVVDDEQARVVGVLRQAHVRGNLVDEAAQAAVVKVVGRERHALAKCEGHVRVGVAERRLSLRAVRNQKKRKGRMYLLDGDDVGERDARRVLLLRWLDNVI